MSTSLSNALLSIQIFICTYHVLGRPEKYYFTYSSHTNSVPDASYANVLHNHSIKEYSLQITFPKIKNQIQPCMLGSFPIKIIKHWGEESKANTEARQVDRTQGEITTVQERGVAVFLQVLWELSTGSNYLKKDFYRKGGI